MRVHQAIFAALLGLLCAGCDPEFYRAETRLLPDGMIERAVYQPLERTPDDVQKSPAWAETHGVRKAESTSDREMSPRDLARRLEMPAGKPIKVPVYWIAAGQFAEAAAVPNHLVFKAPEGLPEGRLVRDLRRVDRGLVTEWTWTETLTDCVTLADHRAARNEVVDMAATILLASCAETWGPEYNLKEFEDWLRGDVAVCFHELCDALLELGLNKHKHKSPGDENWILLAEILKRHGLDMFDADHKLLKSPQADQRIKQFVSDKLRLLVRDKQGRPLSNEHIRDVGRLLPPNDAQQSRLGQSAERVAHASHGGKEQFEEQVNRLGSRLFGLYCWPILGNPQSFDYRMEVPGIVLETNAGLVAEGKLRWKFEASDAFPLGYVMRAVVAVPNTAALQKHFPGAKLDTREAVVEYLDLVQRDAKLLAAMIALVQNNDSTGWDAWRESEADSQGPEKRLIKRLKLKR